MATGARNREYGCAVEWLYNAGIINTCFCLRAVELPLKGNYIPSQYKIYFRDTGLLIASLDEESQADLRENRNFGFNGRVYTIPYFLTFLLKRFLRERSSVVAKG